MSIARSFSLTTRIALLLLIAGTLSTQEQVKKAFQPPRPAQQPQPQQQPRPGIGNVTPTVGLPRPGIGNVTPTTVAFPPMDVLGSNRDTNGILKNPSWAWQVDHADLPDPAVL